MLNIYLVSHLWNDGTEDFVVGTAIIRAKDERDAIKFLVAEIDGPFTIDSDNWNIQCLGWSTGKDMDKEGIVTVEINNDN